MRISKPWHFFASSLINSSESVRDDILMSAAIKRASELSRHNDTELDKNIAFIIMEDVQGKSRDPIDQLKKIKRWNKEIAIS